MFSADAMVVGLVVVVASLLGILSTGFIVTTLVRDELALRRSRRATKRPPWQGWASAQASPAETLMPAAPPLRRERLAPGAQRTPVVACTATQARHA